MATKTIIPGLFTVMIFSFGSLPSCMNDSNREFSEDKLQINDSTTGSNSKLLTDTSGNQIIHKNLYKAFTKEFPQIPIIGEYGGLVLSGDTSIEANLVSRDDLGIFKDDLYAGFLCMSLSPMELKNMCNETDKKYIFNKRAYYVFNENYSRVCSIGLPVLNEKTQLLETPFSIFSIESECFELEKNGTFEGEYILTKKVREILE